MVITLYMSSIITLTMFFAVYYPNTWSSQTQYYWHELVVFGRGTPSEYFAHYHDILDQDVVKTR